MRYQRSLEIEQRIGAVLTLIQSGRYSTPGLAEEIEVYDILFCEAKCTGTHNASLVSDAHDKAANGTVSDTDAFDHGFRDPIMKPEERMLTSIPRIGVHLCTNRREVRLAKSAASGS